MVSNFNDKIRSEIFSSKVIDDIVKYIGSLNNSQMNFTIKLLVSDFYKILLFEKIIGKLDIDNSIFDISIDKILDKCIDEPIFYVKILKGAYGFNKYDFITKIILMREIDRNGFDYIIDKTNPLHILDKITYQSVDELDYYKDYYLDYINNNKEYDELDLNLFFEYIIDRLNILKKEDVDKYKMFLLEFISTYYKIISFKRKIQEKEYIVDRDYFDLTEISNKPISYLFNKMEKDLSYMFKLLNTYFNYITGTINKSAVDKYFYSTTDEKFQKN